MIPIGGCTSAVRILMNSAEIYTHWHSHAMHERDQKTESQYYNE